MSTAEPLAPSPGVPLADDRLRTGLGAAQEVARRGFAEWVAREVTPFAGEWDRAAVTPSAVVAKMAQAGFLAAVIPAPCRLKTFNTNDQGTSVPCARASPVTV